MNDSSDEEKVDEDKKDGGVSPRTLLAIQQALIEEEDDAAEHKTLISSSPTKLQVNIHHPVPQMVLSSSEEEAEPGDVKSLIIEKSDFKVNPTGQSLHVKDSLFVSSEDEMEDVIGQRNKALHFAVLQQSEAETKNGQLTENIRTGSRGQTEKEEEELERRESEHGLITKNRDPVQPQGASASTRNPLSIKVPARICGKPLSAQTEMDAVKSKGSEESESEGTFTVGLGSHSLNR